MTLIIRIEDEAASAVEDALRSAAAGTILTFPQRQLLTELAEGMRESAREPEPLTSRQHYVLLQVDDFTKRHGYAPTFTELAESTGLSPGTIHEHLQNLVHKGWIYREFNQARGITILHPPLQPAAT